MKRVALNELALAAKAGDEAAMERLMATMMPRIRKIARFKTRQNPAFSIEDWEAELIYRLNSAVRRYDSAKSSFLTYYTYWVKAPIREAGGTSATKEREFAIQYGYEQESDQGDLEKEMITSEIMKKTKAILWAHNPRWWSILYDHYAGWSLRSLATRENTNKDEITRILKDALRIVQRRLNHD